MLYYGFLKGTKISNTRNKLKFEPQIIIGEYNLHFFIDVTKTN